MRPGRRRRAGVLRGQRKTALKLAHVRGVALLAIAEAGLELGEYSPLEIKTSVVGYGQAEKRQVQVMVQSLLGWMP
jgi:crossover junction endodeoxyribonuclease RuvC